MVKKPPSFHGMECRMLDLTLSTALFRIDYNSSIKVLLPEALPTLTDRNPHALSMVFFVDRERWRCCPRGRRDDCQELYFLQELGCPWSSSCKHRLAHDFYNRIRWQHAVLRRFNFFRLGQREHRWVRARNIIPSYIVYNYKALVLEWAAPGAGSIHKGFN